MGKPKQLIVLAGEALVERAVRVAAEAGCDPVVMVLGASAGDVLAGCALRGARVVVNEDWGEGMASSIRAGIAAMREEVDAAILMTCDQPAVSAEHLRGLAQRERDEVVGSRYAGKLGVPAYFPARSFAQLSALRGDEGARELLRGAAEVELPGGELDIDTAESLAAARAVFEAKWSIPD